MRYFGGSVLLLIIIAYLFWPQERLGSWPGQSISHIPDQPGIGQIWIQLPPPVPVKFEIATYPISIDARNFPERGVIPMILQLDEDGKPISVRVGDTRRLTSQDYFNRMASIIRNWGYTDVKKGPLAFEIHTGALTATIDASQLDICPKYLQNFKIEKDGNLFAGNGLEVRFRRLSFNR